MSIFGNGQEADPFPKDRTSEQKTQPMNAITKRLIERADFHDKMSFGNDQYIGFFSTWDEKLMRDAAACIEKLEESLKGVSPMGLNLIRRKRGEPRPKDIES